MQKNKLVSFLLNEKNEGPNGDLMGIPFWMWAFSSLLVAGIAYLVMR